MYKYLWQIYTEDSPWEGAAFFTNSPELCTHDAIRMIAKLRSAGRPFIVYNHRLPRNDASLLFDRNNERWRSVEFACSFDDDTDPVWNGFK